MAKDYARETSFTLEPRKTALVIIDMQYASACRTTGLGKNMVEKGQAEVVAYRFDRIEKLVVPNTRKLLDFFRQNKLKVVYVTVGSEMPDYSDVLPRRLEWTKSVRNTRGNHEHEILEELKPLPNEVIVNKLTPGAFNSSNIDIVLRNMGVEYLLLTGVSTNVCVETTGRDAADLGYNCVMVEDACGSTLEHLHTTALENFRRSFGRVAATKTVLKELAGALGK